MVKWLVLWLTTAIGLGQSCTNRWSFNFNGGTAASVVTSNALMANTSGSGPFVWRSFRSGVADDNNTSSVWASAAVPPNAFSYTLCGGTVSYTNTVGLECLTGTNYHWRFIPGYRTTSMVASVEGNTVKLSKNADQALKAEQEA